MGEQCLMWSFSINMLKIVTTLRQSFSVLYPHPDDGSPNAESRQVFRTWAIFARHLTSLSATVDTPYYARALSSTMEDSPSHTVLMFHRAAGWWLNFGVHIIRKKFGELDLFQETPRRVPRKINTPDHPPPTTTSSHASITSLVYYEKTSFPLQLNREASRDIFMQDAVIIDEKDPFASIDPIMIHGNPPHAFILAYYFYTVGIFLQYIGQGIIGKFMDRLEAFTVCLAFCKAYGWQDPSDGDFLGSFSSGTARIVLAAFARCVVLHREQVDGVNTMRHRQEWDMPLPKSKLFQLYCVHGIKNTFYSWYLRRGVDAI